MFTYKPNDDPEEKGPVPSYQFDKAELDRAANALDLILQDHDWQPGENWFDGKELIAKLREKGITLALIRAIFAELIIEGVFTRLLVDNGSECLITTTKAATSENPGRGLFQTWHGYLAARRRASEQGDRLVIYVTLDQMAAIIRRSKRTLEKAKNRKKNPLPSPDIPGGGGKPDEWDWDNVRLWLETESGKQLPEKYPSSR